MTRMHILALLMLGLVFTLGLPREGHTSPLEIIQYEVFCNTASDDELSVKVVNFTTPGGQEDQSFCDFENFSMASCNLAAMTSIADAIEATGDLKCVRTFAGQTPDSEWAVATTCTGKRNDHAKAIRRACHTINGLTGFTP